MEFDAQTTRHIWALLATKCQ